MLCRQALGMLAPTVGRRLSICHVAQPTPSLQHQLKRGARYSRATFSDVFAQQTAPTPERSDRVYADFHVYKTRSAMTVRLLQPTFSERSNGSRVMERDGIMLLEFANANNASQGMQQQQQPGNLYRTYNWDNKITFGLSAVELGNILAGESVMAEKGLSMWHDPAKLGKTGEPIKRLTLKQLPDGAISFQLNANENTINVPVTRGEFEVFKSVAQFAIPRLLGFSAVFSSS